MAALQKEVRAQFLLQNKHQVPGADLLTAAPAAGSPARSLAGQAERSLRQVPAAQQADQGAPHPALAPTTSTPLSADLQRTKHNPKGSGRETVSRARSEMRALEACSYFRCGLGLRRRGPSFLRFTSDMAEQGAHLKSERWSSLVQVALALSLLPSALGGRKHLLLLSTSSIYALLTPPTTPSSAVHSNPTGSKHLSGWAMVPLSLRHIAWLPEAPEQDVACQGPSLTRAAWKAGGPLCSFALAMVPL